MAGLRARLAAGNTVEVAGYTVAPELAAGLERATLQPPPRGVGCVEWFEISAAAEATIAPAAAMAATSWRNAGFDVRQALVRGPAFWQTTEIEEAPALLQATSAALGEAVLA